MSKETIGFVIRKQEIVQAAAEHLVLYGFKKSGLRALSQTIGISDRMIMYYFDTKEDLFTDAVRLIADALADGMEKAMPKGRPSASQMLDALSATPPNDEIMAVLKLWFEIVGYAARGIEPYKSTAALILETSEARIQARLRADQKDKAREVLSSMEGRLLLKVLSS